MCEREREGERVELLIIENVFVGLYGLNLLTNLECGAKSELHGVVVPNKTSIYLFSAPGVCVCERDVR